MKTLLKNLDLAMGNILNCWWPHDDQPNQAGPKFRPVVFLAEKFIDGKKHYIVAYGTTKTEQHKEAKNGGDMLVTAAEENYVVLNEDTRFDFNKVKAIPATDEYFTGDHKGRPVKVSEIPTACERQAVFAMGNANLGKTLRTFGVKV